jgi:hypothetical protein
MPVVHSVGVAIGSSSAVAVGAVVVRHGSELRAALAQHEKPVIVVDPKLERRFSQIAFWDGQEGTKRYFASLVAAILILALALGYGIDLNWKADWKLQRLDGKITLTPAQTTQKIDEDRKD